MPDLNDNPVMRLRALHSCLSWLLIGTGVGANMGQETGSLIGTLCMMIGGVTVLTILGIVLGLIGGDARGSIVGAVGAYLGCWAATLGGASLIPPHVSAMVIFGALVGATAFLFARFLVWKYTMIFRVICWAFGVTTTPGNRGSLALPHFRSRDLAPRSVLFGYRLTRWRSR